MIHEIKQGYKEYLCLDDSVITRDPSTNNGVVTAEKGPIQLHQQPPEQGYNVSQQEIIAMNKELNANDAEF